MARAQTFDAIRPQDTVEIIDRFGARRKGRVVMRGPYGWVLNMGGRHGVPGLCSRENFAPPKKKGGRP